MGAESRVGRAIGRLSLLCAASPRATLVGLAVATLLMSSGILQLETESDLLDIMPEGNPHTVAAQNASEAFRGFYDVVTVFYRADPEKCEAVSAARLPLRMSAADCGNITDEAYVRAMDEIWHFTQAHIPAAEHAIDLAGIIKTVNWTNSGYAAGDPQASLVDPVTALEPQRVGEPVDSAFAMPGTDAQGEFLYQAAWQGANAADDSIKDVVAPTWKAGRTLIFFDTDHHNLTRVELGRQVYAMVDAYDAAVEACDRGEACSLSWNVFKPGLMVRGVASQDAHASDVTRHDVAILAPPTIVALVVILYLSFRDLRMILVAGANLVVAFLWTAGLMGHLGIPFSALNLTIIPMILGVGIDYAIHMVSEYLDHKGQGLSDHESFRRAGIMSGTAMLIATVTTVGGLLLMLLSPSVLMGQLAIVGSIALTVCFVFSITMIPALLALFPHGPRRAEPGSRLVERLAYQVGRNRTAFAVLLLVSSGFALAGAANLQVEALGDPQLNYPKGDRVRDDTTLINDEFFGGDASTQSHYLIVEGDLTRPEVHEFLDRLTTNLAADDTLKGFNTASLTRVVRAWVNIDQGTPDALVGQIVLGNVPAEQAQDTQYPRTQEEIRATFDAIAASPFANFMTILLSEDYQMGMVSFDTRQGLGHEDTVRSWDAASKVIDLTIAETGIEGVQVHQFGNSAVSYLFISKELPWVNLVGIASFFLVTALIFLMTQSARATFATALIMAATSLWWLGVLPALGVGLSVGLMLPLVFISAIGSDNAVHLIWSLEHGGDASRTYRHVGKAILLTMITDVLAFSVFTFQTDLLARETMLATAASVSIMLAATLLIVPLFYPPHRNPIAPGRVPQQAPTRTTPGPAQPRFQTGRAPRLQAPQRLAPSASRK